MERKYRQRGYDDPAPEREHKPQTPKHDKDGPRSPKMTAFQGVLRCGMCGNLLPLETLGIEHASTCPKCRADLWTCRNCVNFDPGARWECRLEIPRRISSKTSRNECDLFTPRQTVEKKTGESRSTAKPSDPRDAFERLFKK